MSNMIQNIEARAQIANIIVNAKNGKRRSVGHAFRSDRAAWLAPREKVVGVVGGMRNMAIYSPAGAREDNKQDRILFYGNEGVLVHEEVANEESKAWFDAAFARVA